MTQKRVLVCAPVLPEADRESGSKRILSLVDFLLEDDWSVTYVSRGGDSAGPYVRMLELRGVETYVGFDEQIDELIEQRSYHLAILVFWEVAEQYLPVVRRVSPATHVLVDSVDLHFLRNARGRFQGLDKQAVPLLDLEYGRNLVRELNVYAAADGVLTVSEKEADLINDMTGSASLACPVPDEEELSPAGTPFSQRQGLLFVGNFLHPPNVDAVEYLCQEIVPRLDESLLQQHPLSIVGNALDERVVRHAQGHPHINIVGWVPSVLPYLERARVALLPLRYGAGTKRKAIQALLMGTPVVSTSIGAEGLHLEDGRDLLIADDPDSFARCVTRLLEDEDLWQHVARNGGEDIRQRHSPDVARAAFRATLSRCLSRPPKTVATLEIADDAGRQAYQRVVSTVRQLVTDLVPSDAVVAVVSKGDAELLELDVAEAWHFPRDASGQYAGHYPQDSAIAIAHLESLREAGAQYLVLPDPSRWWLEHYAGLAEHLTSRYAVVADEPGSCIVFALSGDHTPRTAQTAVVRPEQSDTTAAAVACATFEPTLAALPANARPRVLVLGVYLADKENNAEDIVAELGSADRCDVEQRWIPLGVPTPRSAGLEEVSLQVVVERIPKFQLMNALLADIDVESFDYVMLVDDDVALPEGFVDAFIGLQQAFDFAIAQPARTSNSYIDLPIVEQVNGLVARETRFVEIGPIVSFHRSAYQDVFPFDLRSSMGWGYENVWSWRMRERGLKVGIVDAVPVDHSMRAPVSHYAWEDADRGRTDLWNNTEHVPDAEAMTVVRAAPLTGGAMIGDGARLQSRDREISVIIPTRNRAQLLTSALESLTRQTIGVDRFEVVVVDDGSADDTADVCAQFSRILALQYLRIDPSGTSAAKNLGIFASTAPIVLFFDDDDIAGPRLLEEHLRTHRTYPDERMAVLGHTGWAPSLPVTPLMHYITDVGQYLFAYRDLVDGQILDYGYFWAGRSSCKRMLAVRHGIFDQGLHAWEDVELGYRLSRFGLKIVFNRAAESFMARSVTYDEFAQRCEKHGRAQLMVARRHDDSQLHERCRTRDFKRRWRQVRPLVDDLVSQARDLDRVITMEQDQSTGAHPRLDELHNLYRWTFDALKLRGMAGLEAP